MSIDEAESWLIQTFDDLQKDRGYEKDGNLLYLRVVWQIQLYCEEIQQEVRAVLGRWLLSGDRKKTDDALALIYDLRATEHIPLLEKLRLDISSGRSTLPKLWLSSIDGILGRLREELSHEKRQR